MGTAARELQEVGHVPDKFLAGRDLFDQLAHAPLELAEPDLAGHEVGAARFEDPPICAGQTLGQEQQERGLADQLLAGHQERAKRGLQQRGLRGRQGCVPAVRLDQGLGRALVGPEAAERSQEGVVDIIPVTQIELARERGRERMIDALEESLDERGGRGGLRIERLAELGGVPKGRAVGKIVAEQNSRGR
jgi:hypothetical protein